MTEITHLSELNLMFHCFEPDPISIPLTPDESADMWQNMMRLDDMRYEADMERHDIEAELYYDDRFDDDNADAKRDADDWDLEHETGDWDWRND